MPMTSEYLTRKAIKKDVTMPPPKTPTHSWLARVSRPSPPGGGRARRATTCLWARHLARVAHARLGVEELRGAAAEGEGRGAAAAGDGADARRVRQANLGEEEADADARGRLDGGGDEAHEPLAHARQGEGDKDEPLDKDGGEGGAVRHAAAAVDADDLKGKVGVEAHARRQGDGEVGEGTKDDRGHAGDGGRGGDEVAPHLLLAGGKVGQGVALLLLGQVAGAGAASLGQERRLAVCLSAFSAPRR